MSRLGNGHRNASSRWKRSPAKGGMHTRCRNVSQKLQDTARQFLDVPSSLESCRGNNTKSCVQIRSRRQPGKVFIVGAGPGDPGLMTVRGLTCLRQAQVVVHDRLVHPALLDEASPAAERINVGKAPGLHPYPQAEINALLIAKAAVEGKIVVRLKGGDPFVFGRGAEECQALAQAGVPYEIVPGVSSAIAVPAYAGIPVTHRAYASSFAVVTGHTCGTGRVEWEQLAGIDTLIVLMGLRNLPEIARQLVLCGRAPHTPVAVIQEGTSAAQVVVQGTLVDIAAKASALEPPATMVVGAVVNLHCQLAWFNPAEAGSVADLATRVSRTFSMRV
jgi:uroporphyrin-III C-methyltransferase